MPGTGLCPVRRTGIPAGSSGCEDTEAQVVVPVAGVVPIPVVRPAVLRPVVPAPAAVHAVCSSGQSPEL